MQRNKLLLALAFAVALASGAKADFTGKDASAATITFKNSSGACTSVVCVPQNAITDSTGANYVAVLTVGADAASNTANGLLNYSRNEVFNGTTWDRQASGTALGSILVNNGTAANFLSTATLNQGGSALSATNGIFANILQGNAVISNTNPSFMSVTDGTTKVVVKAASTAAAATDPAFVVAISPNNVIPVKTASGAIASGSYSSGAFASGAYASGSIGAGAVAAGAYVSGSVLSGAYASGSIVDLAAVLTPLNSAAATATKGLTISGQFLSTQPTMTNTLQAAALLSSRGELLVSPGVSGFPITCSSGCGSTGSVSNASSAVATSSTNLGTVGWMYGFNGTTWDQLQVDGSKNLKVNVTNSNANGQATAGNSSPVVLPAAQVTADVCSLNAKTNFTFATSSGTVQLVAPSGSTQVYICSLFSIGATASIQNLVGGTGATCTTGTPVAMAGSTTAANGMSFAANGGFTFGNGAGTALRTTTAGHGVCLIQSGTAALAGGGTFVQL